MENHQIRDEQINASSVSNVSFMATYGRLSSSRSWIASVDDHSPWFQVDFIENATVREVSTQGRGWKQQWVTSYNVSYSYDGENFQFYKANGQIKVKNGYT